MGLYQNVLESADLGVFVNLRDSAGTGITSTLVSTKQALDVNVVNGMTIGAADQTTYTYGTSTFLAVGGVFQDTSPTLTAGQSGTFRLTSQRGVHVNLRTAAGVELLGQQLMAASIPVTIASNQSTLTVTDASLGSATGGTAGTSSALAGAIYNTAAPTLTNGQQVGLQVDVNGNLKTSDTNNGAVLALMKPTTGTITTPTLTSASTTLLASNANRKAFSFVNSSIYPVLVAMAATATSTSYTVRVAANGYFEMAGSRVYTGVVTMITPTVVGTPTIPVTEYT